MMASQQSGSFIASHAGRGKGRTVPHEDSTLKLQSIFDKLLLDRRERRNTVVHAEPVPRTKIVEIGKGRGQEVAPQTTQNVVAKPKRVMQEATACGKEYSVPPTPAEDVLAKSAPRTERPTHAGTGKGRTVPHEDSKLKLQSIFDKLLIDRRERRNTVVHAEPVPRTKRVEIGKGRGQEVAAQRGVVDRKRTVCVPQVVAAEVAPQTTQNVVAKPKRVMQEATACGKESSVPPTPAEDVVAKSAPRTERPTHAGTGKGRTVPHEDSKLKLQSIFDQLDHKERRNTVVHVDPAPRTKRVRGRGRGKKAAAQRGVVDDRKRTVKCENVLAEPEKVIHEATACGKESSVPPTPAGDVLAKPTPRTEIATRAGTGKGRTAPHEDSKLKLQSIFDQLDHKERRNTVVHADPTPHTKRVRVRGRGKKVAAQRGVVDDRKRTVKCENVLAEPDKVTHEATACGKESSVPPTPAEDVLAKPAPRTERVRKSIYRRRRELAMPSVSLPDYATMNPATHLSTPTVRVSGAGPTRIHKRKPSALRTKRRPATTTTPTLPKQPTTMDDGCLQISDAGIGTNALPQKGSHYVYDVVDYAGQRAYVGVAKNLHTASWRLVQQRGFSRKTHFIRPIREVSPKDRHDQNRIREEECLHSVGCVPLKNLATTGGKLLRHPQHIPIVDADTGLGERRVPKVKGNSILYEVVDVRSKLQVFVWVSKDLDRSRAYLESKKYDPRIYCIRPLKELTPKGKKRVITTWLRKEKNRTTL